MSINYKQRFKLIKQYVNFKIDLRKSLNTQDKYRITRYYNIIKPLLARPHQVYRPRKAKNLLIAQRDSQHGAVSRNIKVAFVPTHQKVKIKVNRGRLQLKTGYVESTFIPFDVNKIGAEGYIESELNKTKHNTYTIAAGEFDIPGAYTRQTVGGEIKRLTAKYSDESANNHYSKWLHGVRAHYFKNQNDTMDYLREKRRVTEEQRTERRKLRAKNKRAKLKNA